ncbi:MAG: hypothetical protein K2M98_00880 [Muribaculum sp.]|nr:hypothetical protein [Muribaculum sp.]
MRKFIITANGVLKYGDVNMHKDLLGEGESCIGGGLYEFDYIGCRLSLYGKSYDYGRPKWNWVDTLYVPEAFRDLTITYDDLPLPSHIKLHYM